VSGNQDLSVLVTLHTYDDKRYS